MKGCSGTVKDCAPGSESCAPVTVPKDLPGFYRRPLPENCIAFSSEQGKLFFKEAIFAGTAQCYYKLAEQFTTQSEPAYCGLGTLCMILNALEMDPGRLWKGPWRWFHEDMLGCCKNLESVKNDGITMVEFECVARCNGAAVSTYRSDLYSIEHFRKVLSDMSKREDQFLAVSYSRKVLGQTGDGHFSPIGAYNVENDSVLVLDVARFKYPPYWVKVDLLWDAFKPVDSSTGKPRGYFVIERACCQAALFADFFGVSGEVIGAYVRDVKTEVSSISSFDPSSPEDALLKFVDIVMRVHPHVFRNSLRSLQGYYCSEVGSDSLPPQYCSLFVNILDGFRQTTIHGLLEKSPTFRKEEWSDMYPQELATLLVYATMCVIEKSAFMDLVRTGEDLHQIPTDVKVEIEKMVERFQIVSLVCYGGTC